MVNTIVIHSGREGTGKSTIVANSAALLVAEGQRVGVIDADIQSATMNRLLGLSEVHMSHTFNDYLAGRCHSSQCVYDVSPEQAQEGRLFLVPATARAGALSRLLAEGCNIERITEGLWDISRSYTLDTVIIDTHALLSDESLLSMLAMALADTLAIVLCLDQKDYQGTGVVLDVARTLEIPRVVLIANQVPAAFHLDDVKNQLEQTYQCQVAGVLSHTDEINLLTSSSLFALRYPNHPTMHQFKHIVSMLVAK